MGEVNHRTETSYLNLLAEGIPDEKIIVIGNTVVDAVYQNLEISKKHMDVLQQLTISPNKYFLVTMHRAENVDVKERLESVLDALKELARIYDMPIIFPMHPRTVKMIETFGLSAEGITVLEPLGYLEFLQLEENAFVILTDSGGLQEEGCILGTPCVTLRDNTERPETVDVGANVLAGTDKERIIQCVMGVKDKGGWMNPFGDGCAAERVIEAVGK